MLNVMLKGKVDDTHWMCSFTERSQGSNVPCWGRIIVPNHVEVNEGDYVHAIKGELSNVHGQWEMLFVRKIEKDFNGERTAKLMEYNDDRWVCIFTENAMGADIDCIGYLFEPLEDFCEGDEIEVVRDKETMLPGFYRLTLKEPKNSVICIT